MIDLIDTPLPSPAQVIDEEEKKFRYDESAALNIVLTDPAYLENYRSDRKEHSRVYSDVRIEFVDTVIRMSYEEFVKKIRG